jgi:hypothetical protein
VTLTSVTAKLRTNHPFLIEKKYREVRDLPFNLEAGDQAISDRIFMVLQTNFRRPWDSNLTILNDFLLVF